MDYGKRGYKLATRHFEHATLIVMIPIKVWYGEISGYGTLTLPSAIFIDVMRYPDEISPLITIVIITCLQSSFRNDG